MSLELRNVTKRVGAEVHIHETNLNLEEGSFNTLLGPTLSGKTTFMRLMAGLDRPTSGEIWFRGRNVTGVPVQKRSVSMVHQQFINYPNFTVYENIASPLRVARLSARDIDERVMRVAALLRLQPMLKRRPAELSGGQQQRTALARALVKDSDIILLDEPLANLDYKLREELRDELPKFFAGRNCTVVYATTEPTEALLFGGNTATLHAGRVTQFGRTAEIYRRPTDLVSARVFSDPPINTSPAEKRGNEIHIGQIRLPIGRSARGIPDGAYVIGIRPHHIAPSIESGTVAAIEGRVVIAELSGSESVVHFALGDVTWVSQSRGTQSFELGSTAQLKINMDHAFFFDLDHRRIVGTE